MGIVIAVLLVGLALALGVPSLQSGHYGFAAGLAGFCLMGLALTVAAYGPWQDRFEAYWEPFKRRAMPYVFAAFSVAASAEAARVAVTAIRQQQCHVVDGTRNAAMRAMFSGLCDNFGYQAFAAAHLIFIPAMLWAGVVLWRIARARPAT